MQIDQAKQLLLANIAVTAQLVAQAKSFALREFRSDGTQLARAFATHIVGTTPTQVVVHPTVDTERQIKAAADFLSASLAMGEGLWALVHAGVLTDFDGARHWIETTVRYTTVVGQSGGDSGDWQLQEWAMQVPLRLRIAPSHRSQPPQTLSDGDLFLEQLAIPDLHPGVQESLRQAVRCFRSELYLPCLAMLGRAVEGAWLELGLVLADQSPASAGQRGVEFQSFIREPLLNASLLIARVRDYYLERDLWRPVWRDSDVSETVIRSAAVWSDLVRQSRNAVHYGAESALPQTYENVGVSLLAAGQHLRALYNARRAATALQ